MFSIFSNPLLSSNCTALILSSAGGHLGITRFLVERGANLEAKEDI
jgi:ankyrin repeat protein